MSFSKRIFIGAFVDTTEIEKQLTQIKRDFGGIISGRWVSKENLHITFKFLGETPVERIVAIKEVLRQVLEVSISTELTFKGIGVFPNPSQPKVLYIKVEYNELLNLLKREIEDKLYRIGFNKDIKPFIPHITINRIKEAKTSQLTEKLRKFETVSFGKQKEIKLQLVESILNKEGARYITI